MDADQLRRRGRRSAPRCARGWRTTSPASSPPSRARRSGPRARGPRRAARLGPAPRRRTAGPASAGRSSTAAAAPRSPQQVIFHEEYARADAPPRVNHLGEELLGPTLIAFGTPEQQAPLPAHDRRGRGAVVPGLLRARRRLRPGQRVDHARRLDGDSGSITARRCGPRWRTSPTGASSSPAPSPAPSATTGLSYLLVPMDQPGVEVRPIVQLTGTSEFNEVFFTAPAPMPISSSASRATAGGWRWARSASSAASPRSASRSASAASSTRCVALATRQRRRRGPGRSATGWPGPCVELEVMRAQRAAHAGQRHAAARRGTRGLDLQAAVGRLAPRPRRAGDAGPRRRPALRRREPTSLDEWQRLFLFTRADTIYGGSDEIQRNILAERVLGLPREGTRMTRRPDSPPRLRRRATTCSPARSSW